MGKGESCTEMTSEYEWHKLFASVNRPSPSTETVAGTRREWIEAKTHGRPSAILNFEAILLMISFD